MNKHLLDCFSLMRVMNREQKSKEDLGHIRQKLETLTYFTKFVEDNLKGMKDVNDLFSHLRMEHFRGGEVIFEEGAQSNDKLYVIYTGSAMLLRKKTMDQLQTQQSLPDDPEPEQPQAPELPRTGGNTALNIRSIAQAKKVTAMLMNQQKERNVGEVEKAQLLEQYGDIVRVIRKGEVFGEKALMSNATRTLTVAANSMDLFLVILMKKDFSLIQKQYDLQMKEKSRLIFSIFRDVKDEYSSTRLESMVYSFEYHDFERNQTITLEQSQGDSFYIIQQGEITLSKRHDNRNILICSVSSGHMIGEEVVVKKSKLYEYTATVTSPSARVMLIQDYQFHAKFPQECKDQIIADYRMKQSNRQGMFLRMIRNKAQLRIKDEQQTVKLTPNFFHSQQLVPQTSPNMTNRKFIRLQTEMNHSSNNPNTMRISKEALHNNISPGVTQFCIQHIVNTQEDTLRKSHQFFSVSDDRSLNITTHKGFHKQQVQPYDFGKNEVEQAIQRQHMYEIKHNMVKLLPHYKIKDEHLLSNVIKRQYLKSVERLNRDKRKHWESFVSQSQFYRN